MGTLKQKMLIKLVDVIHRCPFPYLIRIQKQNLVVLPSVYTPKFLNILNLPTCQYMADHLLVKKEDSVLDFGTGTGIQAIRAAKIAQRVYALDINPQAVKCARINAMLNEVENISFIQEDILKSRIDLKVDLVIWTPPTWFGKTDNISQCSWLCGESGEYIKRFCERIGNYLNPNGRVEFICNCSNQFLIEEFEKNNFKVKLYKKQKRVIGNSNYIYIAKKM